VVAGPAQGVATAVNGFKCKQAAKNAEFCFCCSRSNVRESKWELNWWPRVRLQGFFLREQGLSDEVPQQAGPFRLQRPLLIRVFEVLRRGAVLFCSGCSDEQKHVMAGFLSQLPGI
jgi:hypothetical protein